MQTDQILTIRIPSQNVAKAMNVLAHEFGGTFIAIEPAPSAGMLSDTLNTTQFERPSTRSVAAATAAAHKPDKSLSLMDNILAMFQSNPERVFTNDEIETTAKKLGYSSTASSIIGNIRARTKGKKYPIVRVQDGWQLNA